LRVRFRQLGVSYLVENVVSVDIVLHFQAPFAWDPRMLRLYHDFCRNHLEVISAPSRIDQANGGFYLFRLGLLPDGAQRKELFFLPGAEAALAGGQAEQKAGRLDNASHLYADITRVIPSVAFFSSQFGEILAARGRWREARALLLPDVRQGYRDQRNLLDLGFAATHLGRPDEAVEMFERCLRIYDRSDAIVFNLATAYEWRARSRLNAGRTKDARLDLGRSVLTLSRIPPKSQAVDPRIRIKLADRQEKLEKSLAH